MVASVFEIINTKIHLSTTLRYNVFTKGELLKCFHIYD